MKALTQAAAVVIAGVILGAGFTHVFMPEQEYADSPQPSVHSLIGRQFDLKRIGWTPVSGDFASEADPAAGQVAVFLVMSTGACESCLNFPLEARVLTRAHPDWIVELVGVVTDNASREELKKYFRKNRVANRSYLVDVRSALGGYLELARDNSLALVVDRNGQIVLADDRSGAVGSRLPVSQWIEALSTLYVETNP